MASKPISTVRPPAPRKLHAPVDLTQMPTDIRERARWIGEEYAKRVRALKELGWEYPGRTFSPLQRKYADLLCVKPEDLWPDPAEDELYHAEELLLGLEAAQAAGDRNFEHLLDGQIKKVERLRAANRNRRQEG